MFTARRSLANSRHAQALAATALLCRQHLFRQLHVLFVANANLSIRATTILASRHAFALFVSQFGCSIHTKIIFTGGDAAFNKHFGISSCNACAAFFRQVILIMFVSKQVDCRRTVSLRRSYVCRRAQKCSMDTGKLLMIVMCPSIMIAYRRCATFVQAMSFSSLCHCRHANWR